MHLSNMPPIDTISMTNNKYYAWYKCISLMPSIGHTRCMYDYYIGMIHIILRMLTPYLEACIIEVSSNCARVNESSFQKTKLVTTVLHVVDWGVLLESYTFVE